MNSNICVADLRRAFAGLFRDDEFIPILNQALNQLTISGRWLGSLVFVSFDSSTGFITLPYEYSAIMGINVGFIPYPVFSQFHRYIESGPGKVDETQPTHGYLMDMGEVDNATLIDPPSTGSTVRIVLNSAADVGKPFRFYGKSNGVEIFDASGRGINLTTTGVTTNFGTVFDKVTGIECPVGVTSGYPALVSNWSLYAVAPSTTATLLSLYYPPDIRPSYRRYQLGTSTEAIQCLCQRRFIPVYAETDWVYPGNYRAIKAAMQAIQNEDANNYKEVAENWQIAYDTLNEMVHSSRGAARPELNRFPGGDTFSISFTN